jgi:hypothetical protein
MVNRSGKALFFSLVFFRDYFSFRAKWAFRQAPGVHLKRNKDSIEQMDKVEIVVLEVTY